MAYEITKEDVWAGEIEDRPGAVAEKLEAVSRVGADLEFMIARRAPEKAGTGVVFMAPLRGEESIQAARKAGLSPLTSTFTLRVEGPDRPRLGALLTRTVADEGISMRGISGAQQGERSVFYLAFDSDADADKAGAALTNALNR
jgi:hypothetical protein